MFCDMVGSTALSERLDPEDLRDVLVAYRESATRIALGNGGSIVNYAGDGIVFAFGYPRAHENDAARAVHAALQLIDETTRLATGTPDPAREAIAVRIGIHTGLVIAGELHAGNTVEFGGRGRRGAECRGAAAGHGRAQFGHHQQRDVRPS